MTSNIDDSAVGTENSMSSQSLKEENQTEGYVAQPKPLMGAKDPQNQLPLVEHKAPNSPKQVVILPIGEFEDKISSVQERISNETTERKTRSSRCIKRTYSDSDYDHIDNENSSAHRKAGKSVSGIEIKHSGYRGVTWNRRILKWRADIRVQGVLRSLGTFDTEEEAVQAFDQAAIEMLDTDSALKRVNLESSIEKLQNRIADREIQPISSSRVMAVIEETRDSILRSTPNQAEISAQIGQDVAQIHTYNREAPHRMWAKKTQSRSSSTAIHTHVNQQKRKYTELTTEAAKQLLNLSHKVPHPRQGVSAQDILPSGQFIRNELEFRTPQPHNWYTAKKNIPSHQDMETISKYKGTLPSYTNMQDPKHMWLHSKPMVHAHLANHPQMDLQMDHSHVTRNWQTIPAPNTASFSQRPPISPRFAHAVPNTAIQSVQYAPRENEFLQSEMYWKQMYSPSMQDTLYQRTTTLDSSYYPNPSHPGLFGIPFSFPNTFSQEVGRQSVGSGFSHYRSPSQEQLAQQRAIYRSSTPLPSLSRATQLISQPKPRPDSLDPS